MLCYRKYMNYYQRISGFTIVEVIIVIVVLGLLATIGYVGYNGLQERAANSAVQDSLRVGGELLEINFAKQRDYPPNMAGTEYITTEGVETVLYTNAPFIRVHTDLDSNQNAQLLLNACRANMPLIIEGTLYNTGCAFAGNNFHIPGQRTTNTVLHGPIIERHEFALDCDKAPDSVKPICHEISQLIIAQFEAQGGTWPVEIPRGGKEVSLPDPDESRATGNATKFCLEGRYNRYPDVTVGHIKSLDKSPQEGPCPDDPELRYLPPQTTEED